MRSPRRTTNALAAAALLPVLAGCGFSVDAKPAAPSVTISAEAPAPGPSGLSAGVPLAEAIADLQMAEESRDGYEREKFEHWADADDDGCDARDEVLLAEAVVAPEQGADCDLTGGEWQSYYDGERVTDSSELDVDHMIPLAEAWDSGASEWSPERREAFANDLTARASLVAVTASSNRSKSDQDPAEWLPEADDVHCTYTTEWVATKLRWDLTVDDDEHRRLQELADDCPDARVAYEPAP